MVEETSLCLSVDIPGQGGGGDGGGDSSKRKGGGGLLGRYAGKSGGATKKEKQVLPLLSVVEVGVLFGATW
jgi:hypothetical protein